jgi:hypothetical protein
MADDYVDIYRELTGNSVATIKANASDAIRVEALVPVIDLPK